MVMHDPAWSTGSWIGRRRPAWSPAGADLFRTGGDDENRAAVRAVPASELDLVGLALHGPHNAVDEVVEGARMQP